MPANYKYKRLKIEDSIDKKPTKIRKNLNSSERIKSRKQIKKTLNDRHDIVQELRWELEMWQSSECRHNELFGPHCGLESMLSLLEVGEFYLYKCNCIDYDKVSDEEILRMFGL